MSIEMENRITVAEFEAQVEEAHDALQELLHIAQSEDAPYSVDGVGDLEKALEHLRRLCDRFGK